MKSADKKVMSVMVAVSVLGGSAIMGAITSAHSTEAIKACLDAKTDEEVMVAKKNHRFWGYMSLVADITAVCAGCAAGLLVTDAFNLGKK